MAAALSTAWWWDNILDHVEGGSAVRDDDEDGVGDDDDDTDYVKGEDNDVGKRGGIFVKNCWWGNIFGQGVGGDS